MITANICNPTRKKNCMLHKSPFAFSRNHYIYIRNMSVSRSGWVGLVENKGGEVGTFTRNLDDVTAILEVNF